MIGMNRSRFTLAILIGSLLLSARPGFAVGKWKAPFTLKLVYSSTYDDNILNYSDWDLQRFEHGTQPFPAEVTATDDWVNSLGVRLYRDFSLSKQFKFRPYYAGRVTLYAVNPQKNGQVHTFMGRLAYKSRAYLTLKYHYQPKTYLRVYKDLDTGEFHPAEFDLSRPSLSARVRYKPVELEAEIGRETTYYNGYFTEFDSRAAFYSLTGFYTIIENLETSLGYAYKVSDNIGYDPSAQVGPLNPTVDSEYGNADFQENRFFLACSYQLPLNSYWIWTLSLDVQHGWRYYQTQRPPRDDPFHAGRKDRRDSISPALSISPAPDLELGLRFTYELRRTDSPDPDVARVKDYDSRSFEFTFVYQVF
jgi:hypothetical protein